MPWELGFSDALHGRVSILPISESQVSTESYQGQEYLGLYPYVTAATIQGTSRKVLWVNQSSSVYAQFDSWKRGEPLIKRAA